MGGRAEKMRDRGTDAQRDGRKATRQLRNK